MFAPPPQPQSRTFASAESSRNRRPQHASARWPTFIMRTMSLPPSRPGCGYFPKMTWVCLLPVKKNWNPCTYRSFRQKSQQSSPRPSVLVRRQRRSGCRSS